jgi:hypothetical protein
MRRAYSASATAVGVTLLLATTSGATHNEPANALVVRSTLVTGYQACTRPNDFTLNSFTPACSPPQRNDRFCKFDRTSGSGTLTAKVTATDIAVVVRAQGIVGCEGETFCPTLSFRMTTDGCESFDSHGCTAVDVDNQQLGFPETVGCCTVHNGMCTVRAKIGSNLGLANPGLQSGIEIRGCGLQRVTGSPAANGPTFTCGFLVP